MSLISLGQKERTANIEMGKQKGNSCGGKVEERTVGKERKPARGEQDNRVRIERGQE